MNRRVLFTSTAAGSQGAGIDWRLRVPVVGNTPQRHRGQRGLNCICSRFKPVTLLTITPDRCIMRTRSSQSTMSFAPPVTFGLRVSRFGKAPDTRNTQHRTPSGNRRRGTLVPRGEDDVGRASVRQYGRRIQFTRDSALPKLHTCTPCVGRFRLLDVRE
ncbi:MAG: hypothetical protein KatS3mg054_1215 [Chloroflexus sp.]|nr:MAG: hypothetical protein KatS3mg054_1215 [Chloroflexus sp.]